MKLTESYTPEYVLRLQQNPEPCSCQSCQQQPLLVTRRWQNQLRHSALLSCDRAAGEILFRDDAFLLHAGEEQNDEQQVLDERQLAVNQGCINLLITSEEGISVKLYTLGIFISRAARLHSIEAIQAAEQELHSLQQQGAMAQAFAQLPAIDKYKLEALRTLSVSDLDADLDPLTGMTLVLKLNELKILSSGYLAERLRELEQQPQLAEFLSAHSTLFTNRLLWACYHEVFPGVDHWQQHFSNLCQHVFLMKMLIALFMENQLELDDATLAALFAAWQRVAPPAPGGDDALLTGLALLG